MSPPRFQRGDFVVLRHRDEIVGGKIALAARNGRAIAVEFDGVLANCVNMLPLNWDEDAKCFRTIVDAEPVTIERITHRVPL